LAREADGPDLPLDGLEFAPVIPDPDKIICIGLNYRDHVAETGRTETPNPALFARFAGSQLGHLRPLVKPKVSAKFGYEGELAVVIGRGGRHIPAGRALEHVAGYACYMRAACATGSCTPANTWRERPSPAPAPSARGW